MNAARPRLYGRRKGKRLRSAQARLIQELLPRVSVPVPEAGLPLDPQSLFQPPYKTVWIEIGFGGGEHLAAQATAHPEIGFIGCEPFVNGVVKLLSTVARQGLDNIRVHADDARPLLAALRPRSIGRAFILFPDPWPKKRHHKRRFITSENLDLLTRGLGDGAELRLATDDADYGAWILELLAARTDFEGPSGGPRGFIERPADWPPTRYEAKALEAGRKPFYLIYRRRPRNMRGPGRKPGPGSKKP